MGVTVCLPLFGNPGHELEEGAPIKGDHLRNLAVELQERLQQAAERLDKLTGAGWRTQAAMYEVILHHAAVATREEAARRLQDLGIDPEELMIVEDVEEEEDEGG